MKLAVVLLNLGGPLQEADIKPYLFNFFMDPNIIGAPKIIRFCIAKYISLRRGAGAAKKAYAQLDYKSPLLQNTQAQAAALEKELGGKLGTGVTSRVFVAMRYWKPFAREVVQALASYEPDHLVLLPLYPQYSTATTRSALENFRAAMDENDALRARRGREMKVHEIPCYPLLPGFIEAAAGLVRAELEKAPRNARVLFSAHGLPQKTVAAGDPYPFQCGQTAAAIAGKLGLEKDRWRICYQSRIGPRAWTGPSIAEELERAAQDNAAVVVCPHSFVSEHVETLVELDRQYREKAAALGVPYYGRAATVSAHPAFIGGLAQLVAAALEGKRGEEPCAGQFARCGCPEKAA